MSRVLIGMVLVMFAVTMGCSCGGGGSPEAVAKKLITAIKEGDAEAMANYVDWKDAYSSLPEAERKATKFEDWEKGRREEAKTTEKKEINEDWDAQVLGSDIKENTATVKMKIKTTKDGEYAEVAVPFSKVDGKWKIGQKGLTTMIAGGELPNLEDMMKGIPGADDMDDMPDMDDMGDDMPEMPE